MTEDTFKKSKSGKDALKYAKAWQKENMKMYSETSEFKAMCYPNYESGYQVFADEFKAIFLIKDCYLPFEENLKHEEKSFYPISMNKFFPDSLDGLKEIELPEISALDSYIKTEYIKRKSTMTISAHEAKTILILVTLDEERPLDINAYYLQTIMHILPNCKAYSAYGKFLFTDDKGNKALIMGVRISNYSTNRKRTEF